MPSASRARLRAGLGGVVHALQVTTRSTLRPAVAAVALTLLGATGLLGGCGSSPTPLSETLLVFGSEAQIQIRDADAEQFRPAIAEAALRMAELEREWHAWKRPSALVEANAALARGESVQLGEATAALLQRIEPMIERSQGLLDPTVGSLLELWGFYSDAFPIEQPAPTAQQLDAWLAQRPRYADLERTGRSLRANNPAVRLDLAAVAEGAAAEELMRMLAAAGVRNALLSMGGDVVAMGDADGRPWRVGIRDPIGGAADALATVELRAGEAMFVSGNYARFRVGPDGARWPHVLDPRTARPALGVATAAVLGRDPVRVDALVTALMVGGVPHFASLLQAFEEPCALLLTDQNELMISRAMLQRLELRRQPVQLGEPVDIAGSCGNWQSAD